MWTPKLAFVNALGQFETIIDDEQTHFNYFDSVNEHIKKLGGTYLAKIAGTPSSTGLTPKGFAVSGDGE